jgi:vacuolar protein sorting-associated protein 26
MAEVKDENGRKERFFLFYDGESVTGKVNVTLHRKTGKLEHHGIKIEFVGQIELYYDRGNHHEFLSLVKELARPGELTQNTSFDFEFNQVEKPYETYTGANVRLRYFLRVTIVRRLTDMTKELDLAVHTLATYPEMNNPIKMEVGIEECLHIEFEYNKSKYHLKDVIVGKIYFLLVRIKIKHMEIAIIKRESTGSGPNTFHENETIAKYEIMDGAPVRGESIPIRVFLAGYDLTPTMRDINKKFSVRYYLNLVLVDEEERRYFKQQEITLWRKGERVRKLPLANNVYQQQHALARHEAGDLPTEGVRTAPTPSQPPTPYAESDRPLPGEGMESEKLEGEAVETEEKIEDLQEPSNEVSDVQKDSTEEEKDANAGKATLTEDKIAEMEEKLCETTEEKLIISEGNDKETVKSEDSDSLKDMDIVTVSPGRGPTPDAMDSPPDMPDTPPDTPGSPVISLPDAPMSGQESPELQVKSEKVVGSNPGEASEGL